MPQDFPPIDDEDFAALILDRPLRGFERETLCPAVEGRRVLVTGAGGFIGAGLSRLISSLSPAEIILIDNGEFALYSIDAELAGRFPGVPRRTIYCDVRDRGAISRCFARVRPEIVFHAAALKHVPMMEVHPREAVLTNTVGTFNVAEAAGAAGAHAMVLISTDKVVNASSVLGATKRLAEFVCQAMDDEASGTRFTSVRFGNVFGSSGSVVPLFSRQIEAGGPVTLTDPRMTRYFMSLAEATGLVLCASSLALRGSDPRGTLYLLETGSAVRIADIALRMILYRGKNLREVPIEVVGLRAGERLAERLFQDSEVIEPTAVAGIGGLKPDFAPLPVIQEQIAALERACELGDDERLGQLIRLYVAEFGKTPAQAIFASGER